MALFSIEKNTGDGATVLYGVGFPYILQTHIDVYVDGVLQTPTVDWNWQSETQITFTVAPANGTVVTRKRNTPKDELLVDYWDGTTISESQLDLSNIQTLYIVQEAFDEASSRIGLNDFGVWDAIGLALKNLGDPVDANDAVHKGYVDGLWASALADVAAAIAAAAAAAVSESNAAASETAADNWADLARRWATEVEDTVVVDAKYSALHWAAKAAASAVQAAALLPTIQPGDAGKAIIVNTNEDGYEVGEVSGGVPGKNLIHNSDFSVWQRGGNDTGMYLISGNPYSAGMPCDRWNVGSTAYGPNFGVFKDKTDINETCMRFSCDNFQNPLNNLSLHYMQQKLEVQFMDHLLWGTANAKAATVSFRVYSTMTGRYSLYLSNNGNARTFVQGFTVNAEKTWQDVEIVVPGPTDSTWGSSFNDYHSKIGICFGAGGNFLAQPEEEGSWVATNNYGVAEQVGVFTVSGGGGDPATFSIANFKMEEGSSATPYEKPVYTDNMEMCRRYYQKSYDYMDRPGSNTKYPGAIGSFQHAFTNTTGLQSPRLHPPMRDVPSVACYSPTHSAPGNLYNATTAGVLPATPNHVSNSSAWAYVAAGSSVAIGDFLYVHYEADAEL